MIKTAFLVIAGIFAIILLLAILVFAYVWWGSLKKPPAYALIVEKYYVCREQQALYGGIFGKGPTKQFFNSAARQWCWRWEWQEIDKQEFKTLATQWYGVDWNTESIWWLNDKP